MIRSLTVTALLSLVLIGCGSTTGERSLSGAGVGAAVGAAGAAVTDGNVATGAVIGGAAGAATGALTDEDQIDLEEGEVNLD